MPLTKTPVQRLITISTDGAGAVTHAWQQTVFSIAEDGVEISRQQGDQVNLAPADIGSALPQADVLKQLADERTAAAAAAVAAEEKTGKDLADLQAKLDAANTQFAALSAAHDNLTARTNAAAAALAPPV